MLIGSGTNSQAASHLLRNLPYTVDYGRNDRFAVLDQRRPAGPNEAFVSEGTVDPYGLITVLDRPIRAASPNVRRCFREAARPRCRQRRNSSVPRRG